MKHDWYLAIYERATSTGEPFFETLLVTGRTEDEAFDNQQRQRPGQPPVIFERVSDLIGLAKRFSEGR